MNAATKLKNSWSLEEKLWQSSQRIQKQGHHFANKRLSSESYDFSSNHAWIWELDHKKGWVTKNWCFQILVLEKTLESPFNSKEIKSVNSKGNKS